jgi:RNA recognition motif-containing protein
MEETNPNTITSTTARPNENSQVFIAKLHPRVSAQDLKYKFQKCGNIKDIRVKPGYAFIVSLCFYTFFNDFSIKIIYKI